jgi:hypothetical protein
VVGDLHSLPAQLAFELGAAGLTLTAVVFVLFCRHRWCDRSTAQDPILLESGLLSLAGGMFFCLANAPLTILAIPAAMGVAAGASLAARPLKHRKTRPSDWLVGAGYLGLTAIGLLPVDMAHWHYWRAVRTTIPETAFAAIHRAARLDPAFPLYRARAAWLQAEISGVNLESAETALTAAADARGLAPLWLGAGSLFLNADDQRARMAFDEVCHLDPLSAMGPFLRLISEPDHALAPEWGGRALLAEPRLLAATFWEEHQELFDRSLERAKQWPGVPDQRRRALTRRPVEPAVSASPTVQLASTMDNEAATSFSVYAFRREPWPAHITAIPLRQDRLPDPPLRSAARLRNTDSLAFPRAGCGAPTVGPP